MTATASNVLILTANTGGGHRSAAMALEDSLLRLGAGQLSVSIQHALEEASVISRWMADLYNLLLRHRQDWMKYYYNAVEHLKPNESRLIFASACRYGQRVLEGLCPSVIVSVHPMVQHFFAYMLRRLGLLGKIPLVTVVTDPCAGFWRGWACDDVDRYYVASDEAHLQLQAFGVPAERIQTVGMPVHNRFQPVSEAERRALRAEFGLDPDCLTVFLNAGWVGGGNIPRIFEALIQADRPIQTFFLAGRNEKLMKEGYDLAAVAPFPVRVMGYTDTIQDLMNASDVMVSKLGGLTTFEALACHLPVIGDTVTPPMPQEEQTVRFLAQSGAGVLLNDPVAIVDVLDCLLADPAHLAAMRAAAAHHSQLGSADRIARDILPMAMAHPMELETVRSARPRRGEAARMLVSGGRR